MSLFVLLCVSRLCSGFVKLGTSTWRVQLALSAVMATYILLGAFVFDYIENRPDWADTTRRDDALACLAGQLDLERDRERETNLKAGHRYLLKGRREAQVEASRAPREEKVTRRQRGDRPVLQTGRRTNNWFWQHDSEPAPTRLPLEGRPAYRSHQNRHRKGGMGANEGRLLYIPHKNRLNRVELKEGRQAFREKRSRINKVKRKEGRLASVRYHNRYSMDSVGRVDYRPNLAQHKMRLEKKQKLSGVGLDDRPDQDRELKLKAERFVRECLEDVLIGTGSRWTLLRATLFCTGIVTTVGYGIVSPGTDQGKVFCIFYGCIGIPLCILILANLGKAASGGYLELKVQFKQYLRRRKRRKFAVITTVLRRLVMASHALMDIMTLRSGTNRFNRRVDGCKNDPETAELEALTPNKMGLSVSEIHFADETPESIPDGDVELVTEDAKQEEDPGEVSSPLVLAAFAIYIAVGAAFVVLSDPQTSVAHSVYASFLCVMALDFGLFVDGRPLFTIPIMIVYMCIGVALTTMALDTESKYLKRLHGVGRRLRNVRFLKVWFGGDQLSMQDLMSEVGREFDIPADRIEHLDYEALVSNAIAAAKGIDPPGNKPTDTPLTSPRKRDTDDSPNDATPTSEEPLPEVVVEARDIPKLEVVQQPVLDEVVKLKRQSIRKSANEDVPAVRILSERIHRLPQRPTSEVVLKLEAQLLQRCQTEAVPQPVVGVATENKQKNSFKKKKQLKPPVVEPLSEVVVEAEDKPKPEVVQQPVMDEVVKLKRQSIRKSANEDVPAVRLLSERIQRLPQKPTPEVFLKLDAQLLQRCQMETVPQPVVGVATEYKQKNSLNKKKQLKPTGPQSRRPSKSRLEFP